MSCGKAAQWTVSVVVIAMALGLIAFSIVAQNAQQKLCNNSVTDDENENFSPPTIIESVLENRSMTTTPSSVNDQVYIIYVNIQRITGT